MDLMKPFLSNRDAVIKRRIIPFLWAIKIHRATGAKVVYDIRKMQIKRRQCYPRGKVFERMCAL